jgi:hypothetical protein
VAQFSQHPKKFAVGHVLISDRSKLESAALDGPERHNVYEWADSVNLRNLVHTATQLQTAP